MQYWPPALDKQEVYGDIHIGIVNEEQLANFQIRTFKIWKLNPDVRNHLAAKQKISLKNFCHSIIFVL